MRGLADIALGLWLALHPAPMPERAETAYSPTSIVSTVQADATTSSRRRTVRAPGIPSLIAPSSAGSDLTITNYGSATARFTACNEPETLPKTCVEGDLAPGVTTTINDLGTAKGVITVQGTIDARVNGPLDQIKRQNGTTWLPGTVDLSTYNPTIVLYGNGTISARLVDTNGTYRSEEKTLTINGLYRTTWKDLFGNIENNMQVRLNGNNYFAFTEHTSDNTIILPASNSTQEKAYLINLAPDADAAVHTDLNTNVIQTNQYTATNMLFRTLPLNGFTTLEDLGTWIAEGQTSRVSAQNGTIEIEGNPNGGNTMRVIVWGMHNGLYVPALGNMDGATANTGISSIAGLTPTPQVLNLPTPQGSTITAFNSTPGESTVSATYREHDSNGNEITSQTSTLGPRAQVNYTPSSNAVRASITLADAPDGNAMQPSIIALTKTPNGYSSPTQTERPEVAEYEMTAEIRVWTGTKELRTYGTSRDTTLMKVLAGSDNLEPYVGFNIYNHKNSNFAHLQALLDRVTSTFKPGDYSTIFNESYDNLAPFLQKIDNDTWSIDVGDSDWPNDNTSAAPGNQNKGVTTVTYTISPVTK